MRRLAGGNSRHGFDPFCLAVARQPSAVFAGAIGALARLKTSFRYHAGRSQQSQASLRSAWCLRLSGRANRRPGLTFLPSRTCAATFSGLVAPVSAWGRKRFGLRHPPSPRLRWTRGYGGQVALFHFVSARGAPASSVVRASVRTPRLARSSDGGSDDSLDNR
jgi:hypothetical protein